MQFVKTEPGADPIVVEAYIAAPPEAVYGAWTDPEIVMKWFGPKPGTLLSADIDLRVGGAWRFVMHEDGVESMGFEGDYLTIEPNRRLVLNWSKFTKSSGQNAATPMSRVDIVLSPNGSGTDIRIVHSAIDDENMRRGFTGGWEHGIANLCDLFG